MAFQTLHRTSAAQDSFKLHQLANARL